MKVELYATQLALLDRVVESGEYGHKKEEVLRKVVAEHIREQKEPGRYVSRWNDEVVELEYPDYGKKRADITVQPVTGKALPVLRGEVFRIEQVEGGQCVDFNAFNLHDYKEHLSCGATRSVQGFNPRKGELVWTNAPRGRPMFVILEMPDTCDLDIAGHRCSRPRFEMGWGFVDHPNCQDAFAEAIREYGLTPDDVHDSFNLWMSTTIDEQGRRQIRWNRAQKGDHVDFLAMFDTLAVPIVCGSSDLTGISNFTFAPLRVQVFESSRSSMSVVEEIVRRWGKLQGQKSLEDFEVKQIHAMRELRRDSNYKPNFIPVPPRVAFELPTTADEEKLIESLLGTGIYGRTTSEAERISFMRWWNSRHVTNPRPKIVFKNR